MSGGAKAPESLDRLTRVLTGAVVRPCAAGMTFVDPAMFPSHVSRESPSRALARVCADLRLDFAFVPSWEPWAGQAVRELRAVGVTSLWVAPGVLWAALETTGPASGLRLLARNAPEFESSLDVALDASLAALMTGRALGADGFAIADDLAGAGGPIVAPEFLRGSVFPRLAAAVRVAGQDTGAPVLLHCDGAVETLYDDARAAGFAGVHGDCGGPGRIGAALVAARSADIGLIGGLSAAELTDVASGVAAGRRIAAVARAGGLGIADDGGISTPGGHIALVAALRATGRS